MFVCLCTGTTSHVVSEVVANGARTSKDIAEACGAGLAVTDLDRGLDAFLDYLPRHTADPTPFRAWVETGAARVLSEIERAGGLSGLPPHAGDGASVGTTVPVPARS